MPPPRRRLPRRRRPALRPRPARPRPRPRARPAALSPPTRPCAIYNAATDPRSLNPQAASGSDEIEVLAATNRGLLYPRQGPQGRPRDGRGDAGGHRQRRDVHLQAEGRPQVQQRRPDRRGRLRPQHPPPGGSAQCVRLRLRDVLRRRRQERPRRGLRLRRRADAVQGPDAAKPTTFDDAQIDGLLDKLGATAPDDKTLVVKLDTPVNFFPNIMAMWLMTPTNEKSTKFAEAADIDRVRSVHDGQLDPQQRDRPSSRTRTGAAPSRRSPKLRADLRWRSRGRRGRLREGRPRPRPRSRAPARGAWSRIRT